MRRWLIVGVGLSAPAAAHFGGGSFVASQGLTAPTIAPVAACPAVLEVRYPTLGDIHTLPNGSAVAVPNQAGGIDDDRVLVDLRDHLGQLEVGDYDFVAMYTLGEVPGGVNPGYDFSGTQAKNIGFSNAYYMPPPILDRRPAYWSSILRAPHMNGIDHYRLGGTSASPWGLLFHQMGHAWGVEWGWDHAFGYPRVTDWTVGDNPAILGVQFRHWTSAWEGHAEGVLSLPVDSEAFNAFDLYAMGLMDRAEAATHTYRVPDTSGAVHDLGVDDLVDLLATKGTQY
jgi:hypothetical protein